MFPREIAGVAWAQCIDARKRAEALQPESKLHRLAVRR